VILVAFSFVGAFWIDDLALDPFFGFRTEAASDRARYTYVNRKEFGGDKVTYRITRGGAGAVGIEVTVFDGSKRVLEIGGREDSFVGFKDVDGDGKREVLVASLFPRVEVGIWKFDDDKWQMVTPNRRARCLLSIAECLLYARYLCLLGVIMVGVGITLIFSRGKRSGKLS
jgi:hypothetical protein